MISSCKTEVSNLEITTPRQLPKTNTKFRQKTEIIFHYRTENRQTDTERGGDLMFMECFIMTLFTTYLAYNIRTEIFESKIKLIKLKNKY